VKYAYRTAGLVRGKHPYVLVVDDIRKDDQTHEYEWLMQVPDDLELDAVMTSGMEAGRVALNYRGPKPNYVADLILGSHETEQDNRQLLVRVLQNDTDTRGPNQPSNATPDQSLIEYQ
jgi:hypothetical protein